MPAGERRTMKIQSGLLNIFGAPKLPIMINGTSGNDNISVKPNASGGVDVTITDQNGKVTKKSFTAEEAERLVISGGSGNDKIQVDKNVKQGTTIFGGYGNDVIEVGSGKNYIYGGSGNDNISA